MTASAAPAGSSSRLPPGNLDLLDEQRRAVAEKVIGERGRLPSPYRVWLSSPVLAERVHPLGQFLAHQTSLSKAEAEIAILSAARHCGGRYVLPASRASRAWTASTYRPPQWRAADKIAISASALLRLV